MIKNDHLVLKIKYNVSKLEKAFEFHFKFYFLVEKYNSAKSMQHTKR